MSQAGGQLPAAAGGAGQAAGAGGASRPQTQIFRPEQIRTLAILGEEDKVKYETALANLWKMYESQTPGSPEQNEWKAKIAEFSKGLLKIVAERRQQYAKHLQMQQQQQSVHAGGQTQANQGGAARAGAGTQAAAGANPSAASTAGVTANATVPAAAGAQQAPTQLNKVPDHILQHLSQMTFLPIPGVSEKAPEMIKKWQAEMKARYARGLMQMEQARAQMTKLEATVKERTEKGNPLNADEQKAIAEKKAGFTRLYNEAHRWVDTFRRQQETLKAAQRSQANGGGAAAVNTALKPQPNQGSAATAGSPAVAATASNAGLQNAPNATATVNAAIEAARNNQLAAGKATGANVKAPVGRQQQGAAGQQTAPPGLQQQTQSQNSAATHIGASANSQGQQATQRQQAQQQQQAQLHQTAIKSEPGVSGAPHPAPLNTALAASSLPAAGTPTQASARVQTPQSAVPGGGPRALSHTAAMSLANQRGSQPSSAAAGAGQPGVGGTPASAGGVMGSTSHAYVHPGQTTAGQTLQSKFAIPKTLPEKLTQPPQPVAMGGGIGGGRPTYSAGGGIGGGVMGQPAVAKTPAFQLEGEGERVLNKKKLDELVRQVCGGTAEGQEGGALLSPEVEESVLNLADSFVDNVLFTACRNAKERGSKVLEIRDIQLVLERTYNIRIPGYSPDELRTVRKIQPSPAWINKMSAVQAAKVMPGKGDI